METRKVTVKCDDGSLVDLVVPTDLPTEERAEELRTAYSKYVSTVEAGACWKAACHALVPEAEAATVAEAMSFMGSEVDERTELPGGLVHLFSKGYWAHGY